jgi:nitrite reductase/ring-hydroxylating ferredoxin subunit
MSENLVWHPIGRPQELRFDPGAAVTVGDLEIAVFPLGSTYVAMVNSCPHAGGPLADGIRSGDSIECTWHGWSFDLATGACRTVPKRPLHLLPLRTHHGILEVGLPKRD